MRGDIETLKTVLNGLRPSEGLQLIAEKYTGGVKFSSAFGQEDQVITHMIAQHKIPIEIFTLDTGRLFPETYELIDSTRIRYGLNLSIHYPSTKAVERLTSEKGMHSFYNSVEDRKECCQIRKIEPLTRALKNTQVWITGLRGSQSTNRQHFDLVEWDEQNQVIKYNPLINWSYQEVMTYLDDHSVPYNKLHQQGFMSIGCAPCTRAIEPGEDARAGRWWWEETKKECGLHQVIK